MADLGVSPLATSIAFWGFVQSQISSLVAICFVNPPADWKSVLMGQIVSLLHTQVTLSYNLPEHLQFNLRAIKWELRKHFHFRQTFRKSDNGSPLFSQSSCVRLCVLFLDEGRFKAWLTVLEVK